MNEVIGRESVPTPDGAHTCSARPTRTASRRSRGTTGCSVPRRCPQQFDRDNIRAVTDPAFGHGEPRGRGGGGSGDAGTCWPRQRGR
ncbi:hypothetical protein DVS28_a2200 [Euzebya pacifica]|uniref:Uncharacterized protein n=1 Tax=Euzebya pacifica TaxID=1608957 RepID=A0A346XXD5_9ACTN|nr:hypothetical protein DVS28_a2200 [Euzebya pacifica]